MKLDPWLLFTVFYILLIGVTMFLVCDTLYHETYFFMPIKKLPTIADTELSHRVVLDDSF